MTVLLVDDDADEIFLFQEALREIGTNIRLVTTDGSKFCFDMLENIIPDLIFLDVNMPKVSGKDCLKVIKNNNKLSHIPVIMYSTSVSPTDKQFFGDAGVELATKPSSFRELVSFIKLRFLKKELEK